MDHAAWIESNCKQKCSDIGAKAAYMIGASFHGIYNAPFNYEWTDWGREHSTEVYSHSHVSLATIDGNALTNLALFSHELCIRLEIQPAVIYGYWDAEKELAVSYDPRGGYDPAEGPVKHDWQQGVFRFLFHQRHHRSGSISVRHPTIEEAAETFRNNFDESARAICLRQKIQESV